MIATAIQQAGATDASITWLSRNFPTLLLGCFSLGAGEQPRWTTSCEWNEYE
jgi:hypothetical protein